MTLTDILEKYPVTFQTELEVVFKIKIHDAKYLEKTYGMVNGWCLKMMVPMCSNMWDDLSSQPFIEAQYFGVVRGKVAFRDMKTSWSFSEELIKDIDFVEGSLKALAYI
jgi:hypothetical protein